MELSDIRKQLIYYFKDNGFHEEEMLAVCLLCRTDGQAEEMLEYCQAQTSPDYTTLLERAVEIYQNGKTQSEE